MRRRYLPLTSAEFARVASWAWVVVGVVAAYLVMATLASRFIERRLDAQIRASCPCYVETHGIDP